MPIAFVYGALMLHPAALRSGRAAWVDDWAVRFTNRGLLGLEPAFAALEPEPGAVAWGVLAEFTEEEWARAVRDEFSYAPDTIRARTRDGAFQPALMLRLLPHRRASERGPSARYARLLAEGAALHGLPPEVVQRYRRLARAGPRLSMLLAPFKPLALPWLRRWRGR